MKFYAVTDDYLEETRKLFSKHFVELLPKDRKEISADLIIFSGGCDINPVSYGRNPSSKGWYDNERDELELGVMRDIRTGRLKTKKVFGICRGLQLMNVSFGGTLIQDITQEYGNPHKYSHPISWLSPGVFSSIGMVNSLHHQGIRRIGSGKPFQILGVEPNSKIIEAIIWEDRFLAFQFHPELFPECKEKTLISTAISDWVDNKLSISQKTSEDSFFRFKEILSTQLVPDLDEEMEDEDVE